MNNLVRRIKNILIVVLLLALIFLGFGYYRENKERRVDDKIITSKIEGVKELTTLKYSYTNMAQFENSNKFYGYDIPFTEKKFIVAYDGVINFGVDLDDMDVNVSGKNINIKLPDSKVLSHEIYEDSLKVFDQKTSIFNPIKAEDYNDFSKNQKKKIEKKAIDKGLIDEANKKCEKAIEEILNVDENIKEYNIKISFK